MTSRRRWQGQWDSTFLYLHLSVDDAKRRPVDASKPTQFWQGDGVSFEFGPDVSTLPPRTKPRSGKDFHVMVGVTPLGGLASFNMANAGAIREGGRLTRRRAVAHRPPRRLRGRDGGALGRRGPRRLPRHAARCGR